MSCASAWSIAMIGLDGQLVEVESALGAGLPRTVMVGLPDTALYQARERCKAALSSCGYGWPQHLLTINLTPASLPKAGSHFDLAIAASVLHAMGRIPADNVSSAVLFGELGLDGRIHPVPGIMPAVMNARRLGRTTVIVPGSQVREASLVTGIQVFGVDTLQALVGVLCGDPGDEAPVSVEQDREGEDVSSPHDLHCPDMSQVLGQEEARFVLEVAAAGRHHLLFQGPPGQGKTMLAERLPTILPDLSDDESVEVTAIQSLMTTTPLHHLVTRPPWCDPHYNISMPALVGGGARSADPGVITRAHRGVLFLDEVPEYSPRVLDALRTPLESGVVTISRTGAQVTYPADFQLVAAANPCKCGNAGVANRDCTCTPYQVRRYQERLSGPLLDRIDLRFHVRPLQESAASVAAPETSAVIRDRVTEARLRQRRRLADFGLNTNSQVSGALLRSELSPASGLELVMDALNRGRISRRGADKILRVAWTISDIQGSERPGKRHVLTSLALRAAAGQSSSLSDSAMGTGVSV